MYPPKDTPTNILPVALAFQENKLYVASNLTSNPNILVIDSRNGTLLSFVASELIISPSGLCFLYGCHKLRLFVIELIRLFLYSSLYTQFPLVTSYISISHVSLRKWTDQSLKYIPLITRFTCQSLKTVQTKQVHVSRYTDCETVHHGVFTTNLTLPKVYSHREKLSNFA